MAGPTAAILLPGVLTDIGTSEIWDRVAALGRMRKDTMFWVETTAPIDGRYAGEGRPFFLDVQPLETENDPEDIDRMTRALGFRPLQEIVLGAMCNGSEDHRILGEICLWLADWLGGTIDLGGHLPTPLPPELRERMNKLWWGHPDRNYGWDDLRPTFEQMVRGMPGRLLQLEDPPIQWPHHLADTTFMRAWLTHPDFRMVK